MAYASVYLIWGSTYLAMHIALETLPPFVLASARFFAAAVIILVVAAVTGHSLPTRTQWARAAVVALFLLVGGNTAVLWALKTVPSGVAALLVSTTPLWLAILARSVNARTALGIALGLVGVAILVGPSAFAGAGRTDPLGAVVLVLASLSWAIGSLIQRAGDAKPLVATGAQMLCGGVMLGALALGSGELHDAQAIAHASARSWLAVAYLCVFGSLIGFTSFAWLMNHDDPARVATYAYVNPIVAVLLGALLAHEPLSPRVAVAGAVIISGVIAIVSAPKRQAL